MPTFDPALVELAPDPHKLPLPGDLVRPPAHLVPTDTPPAHVPGTYLTNEAQAELWSALAGAAIVWGATSKPKNTQHWVAIAVGGYYLAGRILGIGRGLTPPAL